MKTIFFFPEKTLALIILTCPISFSGFAQWSQSVNLSPNAISASLNENMGPCLAVNGDTIHVVWCDHRASGSAIYYKRSIDTGMTWNSETPITDTTGSATFPAIAVSGSTVHVVWMDTSLGQNASFYKRSLDGGNTWGPSFCLDSDTKFWPGIAASGSIVVVSLNKEVTATNTEVFFKRSIDNGITWDAEQQISNADNRSEDPAIAVLGSDVYLSWNDKRSGTMEIYYRHSADAGITWGPETALTTTDSYTSMVSLDHSNVDVPYGNTGSGNFDIYIRQSADTGLTFAAAQQLTNDPDGEAYPYLVRDGLNLHLVYPKFGMGIWYLHSGNGGAMWGAPFFLANGGESFIAITGCMLHVIYADSGAIYYKRNPTGNCGIASDVSAFNSNSSNLTLTANPNLFNHITNIEFTLAKNSEVTLKIYDLIGHEVASLLDAERKPAGENTIVFDALELAAGMYLCCLKTYSSTVTTKLMLIK